VADLLVILGETPLSAAVVKSHRLVNQAAADEEVSGVELESWFEVVSEMGRHATILVPVLSELISKVPPSCLTLSFIPVIPTPGVPTDVMRSSFSAGQSGGSGVGIRGMRERVAQFSGTLKIESDSSGTAIHVAIPIAKTDLRDEAATGEPLQSLV